MQAAPAVPPPHAEPAAARRAVERAQAVEGLCGRPEAHRADRGNGSAGGLGGRTRGTREHIRALQQEWRTINKGIASNAPAETERFQQAFQAAFKPCQEFFALQAVARRETLEARKQVLERLKAFEATQQGEQADFPLVAQVLREAPREWRSDSPVDRDESAPPRSSSSRRWTGFGRCSAAGTNAMRLRRNP